MKTYSKEGTPLAEATLVINGLAKLLTHPELAVAISDLALDDAVRTELAVATRFLTDETLGQLPLDALVEAFEDLPVGKSWPDFLSAAEHGDAGGLSEDEAALALRIAKACQQQLSSRP